MAGVLRRAAAPLSRHLGAAALRPTSPALRPATRFTSAGIFRRHHHHTGASEEAAIRKLEERLVRLEEMDPQEAAIRKLEERIVRLEETDPLVRQILGRVSTLEAGTARFKVQMQNKILSVELKVEKGSLGRFQKVSLAQINLHRHVESVEKKVRELETASDKRDVDVLKYEVQSMINVKQAAWKVAFTILFGGTTVAFGVINLITSHSKNEHTKEADRLIRSRTEDLEKMMTVNLQTVVKHEVATAMAKEALKRANRDDQPPGGAGPKP